MATRRKPGISVLIAAQNEEAVVGTCIRSFLDFGDELVVVDNGSTDGTKEIVRDLEARHPKKIKFFDVPDLPDLHHNRQYALERSSYQWIVRGDADFVAYTDGECDIARCREFLLARPGRFLPAAVAVPLCNVCGDLWHTGLPMKPGGHRAEANADRKYIPPAITGHRVRIYRHIPGLRFQRCGRWESARYHLFYQAVAVRWRHPLWMHCNIKPDLHHLFRSERTNWRELGALHSFPTLRSYIGGVVEDKYGTRDLHEAAVTYMSRHVLPHLERYDVDSHYPYPRLVLEQMKRNPVYRIVDQEGTRVRRIVAGSMAEAAEDGATSDA